MVGLVFASWLAMQVQGLGTCPVPGQVEEKLAPLLPIGFASSSTDRAAVMEESDGTLSVLLARVDGKTIARRRLPRAATCSEQAQTVAVALAVWEAQIHPETALRLDRLTPPPTPPRAAPPPVGKDDVVIARVGEPGRRQQARPRRSEWGRRRDPPEHDALGDPRTPGAQRLELMPPAG